VAEADGKFNEVIPPEQLTDYFLDYQKSWKGGYDLRKW